MCLDNLHVLWIKILPDGCLEIWLNWYLGSRQNGSESGASYDGDISGQEGFLCPMCMSRWNFDLV